MYMTSPILFVYVQEQLTFESFISQVSLFVKTSGRTLKTLDTHAYLSAAIRKQKFLCFRRNTNHFNDLEKKHSCSNCEGKLQGALMHNSLSFSIQTAKRQQDPFI